MKDRLNKVLIISKNHFPRDMNLKEEAFRLLNEGNKVTICEFVDPIGKELKIKEEIAGITVYRAYPLKRINGFKSILGEKRKYLPVEVMFNFIKHSQHFFSIVKLFGFSGYISLINGFDLLIIPPEFNSQIVKFYRTLGKRIKTFSVISDQKAGINRTGKVQALWLKEERKKPMLPQRRITLVKGKGIKNNVAGKKRQITIIQKETWEGLMKELGLSLDPSTRRANLMISGLELRNQRNRILRIGKCRLLVIDETKPCRQMDEAWEGLCVAMTDNWAGGSYAEILDDGDVTVGDEVFWEA